MKLNPTKCIFGVPAGKLLGFIVSQRGIEVNPEKIDVILKMEKPCCVRDVQRFAGCVDAVSRFISRLGEKALPLYRLLKKAGKFVWNVEADTAFEDLKRILSTALVLAAPMPKEPMLLYIAATNRVVSVVVAVERPEDGKAHNMQQPVYYVSEVLKESKQRYPHYHKLAYGVFLATRRLKHYFQEHPVKVISTAPLANIIQNCEATGRVTKWAIELAAHTITYKPRRAIKSQALADFLVDWTESQQIHEPAESKYWHMYFDGSKMIEGSGAGVVLESPKGDKLEYVLQIHFTATNNVAEYEALLHGLRMAKEMGITRIVCHGDSDLVIQQCNGTYDTVDPNMAAYRQAVDKIGEHFAGFEFKHVDRRLNEAADALS
jgi:ribonuclease HI